MGGAGSGRFQQRSMRTSLRDGGTYDGVEFGLTGPLQRVALLVRERIQLNSNSCVASLGTI